MKKLLIATTALVATAGVAAAEVKVSGNGRMGVVYGSGQSGANFLGNDALNFSSRIRVAFTLSGETDAGLSFGGTFRADVAGDAATGADGSIFVSGAFGKLTMGLVAGAAETVVGDLPEIGFQDLQSQGSAAANRVGDNDILYLTGDGGFYSTNGTRNPGALYTYTTGGLTFALGLNDGNAQHTNTPTSQQFSLGVKYAFGDYSVALGYENSDLVGGGNADHMILGADAKFGTTTVKVYYGDGDLNGTNLTHYGIGVTSKFDALTVKGYVKNTEIGGADATGWGLGADYDLGGGATLAGGIADNDIAGSDMVADLGIKFTF